MLLNKFGVCDRETIRFKENIALAVSGDISPQKLLDATSLSSRKMRTIFDCETTEAIAEKPSISQGVVTSTSQYVPISTP